MNPLLDGLLWPVWLAELLRYPFEAHRIGLLAAVFPLPATVAYARSVAWRLWRLLREGRVLRAALEALVLPAPPVILAALFEPTARLTGLVAPAAVHLMAGAGVAGETYMLAAVVLADATGLYERLGLQRTRPERLTLNAALGAPR